ncbi:MAG: transcription termination factor Rho [Christensenellales bacterium]
MPTKKEALTDDEMREKIFSEKELYSYTIFILRRIATLKYVKSPTSKKKAELIEAILDKQKLQQESKKEGAEEQPRTRVVRRGSKYFEPHAVVVNRREDSIFPLPPVRQPIMVSDSNKSSDFVYNTMSTDEMLEKGECERKSGILEILADGYGFLRAENCEYSNKDTYVSNKIIKTLGLRMGDMVEAIAKKNAENKPPAVIEVEKVNGLAPTSLRNRPNFDKMTPIYPDSRLKLEVAGKNNDFAIRCIDLIAPIGKGQRAMIVSPPKAGKTTLLKKIATAITANHPEVELFVLLVDERPEEVTDMQRSIKGEVIYSTFDETPEHHCKAAELLIEKAKRYVETGKDVVIIMDSLTRLARAYNLTVAPTGRTLSGGIDPGALHPPKRFFGSARNIENGGSLTIIATALVDTGSRMDEVIYEEFKGTGNMEIHLDRKLSERRIFPAIDLNRSSTRREDLLLSPQELSGVWAIRRMLSGGDNAEMTEQLFNMIVKTKTNEEFIDQLTKQLAIMEKEGYSFRKPN